MARYIFRAEHWGGFEPRCAGVPRGRRRATDQRGAQGSQTLQRYSAGIGSTSDTNDEEVWNPEHNEVGVAIVCEFTGHGTQEMSVRK